MDATSPSILQDQNGRHFTIIKDSSLRTAFSAAYSLFLLHIHSQDGRDQAQMLKYLRMPSHLILLFHLDIIYWLMQDFHIARNYLFLIEESIIIYKNGGEQN
jgi:hypothetical protein